VVTVQEAPSVTAPARRPRRKGDGRAAARYLAPAGVLLAALLAYPIYQLVLISFYDYGQPQAAGNAPLVFLGFANYADLLSQAQFWTVLGNTVGFAAACVAGSLVVGTGLAVLASRVRSLPRTLLFLAALGAWSTPAIAGSYVWLFLFDTDFGLVNEVLSGLGLPFEHHSWTFGTLGAFGLVAAEVIWCSFPFVLVTMYAGIKGVPDEVLEAASLDGASTWRTTWTIVLPMVRPLLMIATVQSIIWDFKVFTQIYLMPGGSGTNRDVLNLGTWSYITAISQNRYGLGAAIAVLLTLLLLVITLVYLRTLFKQDEL
jgi:N,N'-diacetylchitobiose transport system permease protein